MHSPPAPDEASSARAAPEEGLYFRQLLCGQMANFVYLIGCRRTREAVIVDPAWEISTLLEVARQDDYQIKAMLITHWHPDHAGGNLFGQNIPGAAEMLEHVQAKVYIHKSEVERIAVPRSEIVPTDAHTTLEIGDLRIACIHTPGHTPGSQCFQVHDRVVSGDTLFIGSCGRTDLPDSNPADLYSSLQKLMKLEEETLVFPGHNYAEHATHTTMGTEKRRNPFCRFGSKTEFLNAMGYG